MKSILVSGGAGYIGSHTCVELLNEGFSVTVLDNLSNSKVTSIRRVEEITGKQLEFIEADIRDRDTLFSIFETNQYDAVIHFAGLKAVGESNEIPLAYYQNNVTGTLNLCEAMAAGNCKNIVFSSSATVYGEPETLPIDETFPCSATNPYGRSKLILEEIFGDLYKSDNDWNIALLRYFNPGGSHPSGLIGEDPNDTPNNLLPYVSQVAIGKLETLSIFGDDYDTPDGTGVRDYIHVVDLALGHIRALAKLTQAPGLVTYNLGTGIGYSVLEMVKAFEESSGNPIPYKIVPRRDGDIAACYADPTLAATELDWKAQYGLKEMTDDAWRWQTMNPNGYEE